MERTQHNPEYMARTTANCNEEKELGNIGNVNQPTNKNHKDIENHTSALNIDDTRL